MDPDRVQARERLLVERARAGDQEAFAELVRSHQDDMYTLAFRLTADRDLAADVAQEAMIRAWRGIGGFRGDASFSTWLYRITANTAWTLRARRRRRAWLPLELAERVPAPQTPESHPETAGDTEALRRRLVTALARLPAGARQVVVLKDVEGMSHVEIAATLGITTTAAKVRLHRARLRLRRLLEEGGT